MAHSSAVYVTAGQQQVLVREDLELAMRWVDRLWAYLIERDNFGSAENQDAAGDMIGRARQHFQDKLSKL